VFQGSFEHAIDDKGRISIPARFREIIEATGSTTVVMTRFRLNSARCLDVYPAAAWERFEEDFHRQKRFDRDVILFENFYLGNAQPCEIDRHGRVLVPPLLREWASLARRVVLAGARDKFRIWDHGAWARIQEEAETALDDPGYLRRLNL
jgi:MraZ protein